MKLPRLFLPFIFVFSLSAQDSLPKTRIKLFDLNMAATLTGKESANLSMNYVRSFAGERHFLSDDFTALLAILLFRASDADGKVMHSLM